MKELLGMRATECSSTPCYRHVLLTRRVNKNIAALATVFGGLDTLIFTAVWGEHGADIRLEICP